MQPSEPRHRAAPGPHGRRRGAALVAAVATLIAVAAFAVPGTSGAFTGKITNSADNAAVATRFTCDDTFNAPTNKDNSYFEYKVASGSSLTTASDVGPSGNNGTYQGGHTTDTVRPIACPNDVATSTVPTAWKLDGSTNYMSTGLQITTPPATFSLAVWFKTSTAGGYLMGFASDQTGAASASYDRHMYINTSGKLVFGTSNNGTQQVVTSTNAVNNGVWHQAVATMSGSTGMTLWVDGQPAASSALYTAATGYTGYWRIGYGKLANWTGAASNLYFTGSIRYVATYRFVLSSSEIAGEYRNGAPA